MPSTSQVAVIALLAASKVFAGTLTCSDPILSCQDGGSTTDTCCVNTPGGQFVQTQFWDTDPATGPSDSWTIHGLWPDHCDGTYDSNCDSSREYTNISSILEAGGKSDVLDYMNSYWLDENGDNESFWEHEWGKHGTCISTLEPSCYSDYTPQQEVLDYFQRTVDLFKGLDSYKTLSDAGIVPSDSDTYTSADIQAAFKASYGFEVSIQCDGDSFNEIWYAYYVRGSVADGEFVPTAPAGSKSNCPDSGITYAPKPGSGGGGGGGGGGDPPSGSFSGSGYLTAVTDGTETGCLISSGTWYVSGTCATYTATASDSGFTLESSKGACGISSSQFTCGSGVEATVFTDSDGYLAVDGSSDFSAPEVPSGSTQENVSTGSDGVVVKFQWKSV